jgi:CRP/FNR family transcriptional regulator, cyclic AMP receptor protein
VTLKGRGGGAHRLANPLRRTSLTTSLKGLPARRDSAAGMTRAGGQTAVAGGYRIAGKRGRVVLDSSWEAFVQTVTFKAGDTIIAEGDEGDAAFFIVSGTVEVFVGQGPQARRIGALNAGEVFGEMSLIEPGPRSATVTATADVECLAMSYEEFMASIEDHPDRAVAFMKTLVRRLRQMNELITSFGPDRRGLRGLVRDLRKSAEPAGVDREVADLSWTMLW